MNSEIDFKQLWSGRQVSQPSVENIYKKVNDYKKSRLWKTILLNTTLVITALVIVFIWRSYTSNYASTKIGIVFIVLAIAVFLVFSNKNLRTYTRLKPSTSNQEYLQNLLEIKRRQKFLQTKIMSLYFMLLSSGLGLYMYEYAVKMPGFWAIFSYAVAGGWILFAWFYMRPRQIKKENAKIDEVIKRITEIQLGLKL